MFTQPFMHCVGLLAKPAQTKGKLLSKTVLGLRQLIWSNDLDANLWAKISPGAAILASTKRMESPLSVCTLGRASTHKDYCAECFLCQTYLLKATI